MEENVALDTSNQKKFVKSIKGIKKLIKKKENEKSEEPAVPKPKNEKHKRKRPDRGLVYLSHIPHGFYEHEMNQYFKQFGVVTNVRVIRSKRTGNSKGFAFVEFKEPAVGEIVAETMNNYLMGKRLIKAAYVPPEKQRPNAMRKHWSRLNNPGRNARLQLKKAYNADRDDQGELKRARQILSNINKTKKKLSELGINYDFFTPVDIPEALQTSNMENKISESMKETTVKVEKKSKKDKKIQDPNIITKEPLKKSVKDENKVKLEKNKAKVEVTKVSNAKVEEKTSNKSKKDNKKNVLQVPVVSKSEQKEKKQKLKDAGVKPPENFIKVQADAEDSDSSMEFDSDEFEKMLGEESDDGSDIDEGSDDDEASDDDEGSDDDGGSNVDSEEIEDDDSEEEEVAPPPKKNKGKLGPVPVPQKQGKKQKGPIPPSPAQNKRKSPQKPPLISKKPKFEKQTVQPMKKQFKKKK